MFCIRRGDGRRGEMSRYEVVHNLRPHEILLVTDCLDEACWFVGHERLWRMLPWHSFPEPAGNKFREEPPLLAPDIGAIETKWHVDSVPGELQRSYVIFRDGRPIVMGDDEVLARARRYKRDVLEPAWRDRRGDRRHGRKRPTTRWSPRPNAYHRTMRLDDRRDSEVPSLRPGARVPDAWDNREGGYRISRCWKDQSKRRRQWRPIDMPPQDDGRDEGDGDDGHGGGAGSE